eukprot:CAMPEP_0170228746 /NCGR_PEP_ID=MMETSP0116_2-20130129/14093_1 /TAXON_ID=400756 /ORGANISM="Durinskia baltica, Strain CSIRO CS-38" /LENGTH=442 /DNA_ID=CAMNT_0010479489 /DNA_START=77 /DNA_END=1402 /DNA_ORIENTATION=-
MKMVAAQHNRHVQVFEMPTMQQQQQQQEQQRRSANKIPQPPHGEAEPTRVTTANKIAKLSPSDANARTAAAPTKASSATLQGHPEHDVQRRPTTKGNQSKQQDAVSGKSSGSRKKAGGSKSDYLRLQLADVLAAVQSLYADKLKPFGRILLKRIRERNAAAKTAAARANGCPGTVVNTDDVPLLDPRYLRRVCDTCVQLQVEPEDGKEYSVYLLGQPRNFIDVSSPVDCYPPYLWHEASEYFAGLHGEDMLLPGGRYACAQLLAEKRLPFLAGYSLGAVCHIVHLAVSQRRILGYIEGNMVPFGRSAGRVKEQCAASQQPVVCNNPAIPEAPPATLQEARRGLLELFDSAEPSGRHRRINLSNVKRLFRSRFGLSLSETALGHSSLHELLEGSQFADLCYLELHGKSQYVIQRTQEAGLAEQVACVDEPAAARSQPAATHPR